MHPITNVLFDLGVVLLNIDSAPALQKILPLCDPHRGAGSLQFFSLLQRDPTVAEYECGRLSAQELFRHFVMLTGFRGTFPQFRDIWCGIFSENQPMIAFARELAARYDTYIWSNAGDLHVPWVYERFPALQFFKGDAISCYLGEVKPNRAFYVKALAKFSLRAADCLFIDDRPENVASARECGIEALLYSSADECLAAVRARLNGTAGG